MVNHPAAPVSMLQFLKLGGSLITDKAQPHTARLEVIARLAQEIAAARQIQPGLRLVLGHGSGSFGHIPARQFGTRQGVHSPEQWVGFAEVWRQANALNRLVMDSLHAAHLPAVAFSPSASVTASDGQVVTWNLEPLEAALQAGLLPVIHGDVIFDQERGGTILSTEDLFVYLAHRLYPRRLLLAGLEAGVWADFPGRKRLVAEINQQNAVQVSTSLGGSAAVDVTGGMASKVVEMLALAQAIPTLEIVIFSGEEPGLVRRLLLGETCGTLIHR